MEAPHILAALARMLSYKLRLWEKNATTVVAYDRHCTDTEAKLDFSDQTLFSASMQGGRCCSAGLHSQALMSHP